MLLWLQVFSIEEYLVPTDVMFLFFFFPGFLLWNNCPIWTEVLCNEVDDFIIDIMRNVMFVLSGLECQVNSEVLWFLMNI